MDDDFWKNLLKGLTVGLGVIAGAAYLSESSKKEPEHARFSLDQSDRIKQALVQRGGQILNFITEIRKFSELWGIGIKLENNMEIHIRAIKDQPDSFYLSAHYEYSRDSLDHLKNLSDYETGKKILIELLKELNLWNDRLTD